MSEEQTINLELSLDDVNKILEALGSLPFSQVYQLIGSIQRQAQGQLGEQAPAPNAEG